MPQWSELTRDEVGDAARAGLVAVLPVGAIEQHGSHLATGTDALLAERAVGEAVTRAGDIALPVFNYGCSLGHTEHWPGTLSLSVSALTLLMTEIGRWVYASGFRKLAVVNSHATTTHHAKVAC